MAPLKHVWWMQRLGQTPALATLSKVKRDAINNPFKNDHKTICKFTKSLFFCKINGPMVRWSNGPIISILQFLRHFQVFESKNYILLSTHPGSSYVLTYFFVDFLTYWVRDISELQFESFLKKDRIEWTHFFGKSSWKITISVFKNWYKSS